MRYFKASQCRAARGLLGWSQPDLSGRSGVHVQTISAFEKDTGSPTNRTLRKIADTFERNGIVFTAKGIEYDEYPIIPIEGISHEACYIQLLEDAWSHLHEQDKKKKELLIMYADDRVSPPSVNNMYRKMRAAGIGMRQLIQEGNNYIIGPLSEYRYIPKNFFINRVTLIYGDRIATEKANFNKAIIRIDPMNAEIERNTFNMLWSVLKQPTLSTSKEKF
jgi:transcriptional regulator with XRE-family HTH domain